MLERRTNNHVQLTGTHGRFRVESNKSCCRERDSDRVISLRLMTPLRTAVGAFKEPDYRVALIVCLVFLFLIYCKIRCLTVLSKLANITNYSQKVQDASFSGKMWVDDDLLCHESKRLSNSNLFFFKAHFTSLF